ncbi:Major facilitator superfamily domain [Phytophthora cactorum]|nr:Major facilitator superfamily domain [Phytophthora cactorum]
MSPVPTATAYSSTARTYAGFIPEFALPRTSSTPLQAHGVSRWAQQARYPRSAVFYPDPSSLEGGALRGGGTPVLTSSDSIGLLFQYAAVGINYGLLPATVYPFLQQYLNATGSQVTTASTLVILPWSFKVFYGILSDCVPLWGYRRKVWMLVGWAMCLTMLIVMAASPAGNPYYTVSSDRKIDPADYTPEIEARINYDAGNQAGKYVMLMFFAAIGYVLADVCADSIVVEYAQREPVEQRGKIQSAIYTVRTVFVIIGQLLVGFCFNGEEYGGQFDFSLNFPELMAIVAVITAPIIPITWLFIKEEKQTRVPFKKYMSELWELIQKRAVYQVIFYQFFQNVFSSISYTASSPVQSYMVGVTPINNTISEIISNMILFTGIFVIIADGVTTFLTIWNVFRSQWFWLGIPMAVQLPYGVGWMIGFFVIVELSGVGNEGAIYGLITMVGNLASPFAQALTLVIDQPLNLTTARIQADDNSIRTDLTYAVLIMYGMTIFSWSFLVFLPPQKAETQELLRTGGSSKILGGLTVFYVMFAFVWSLMTNIMAMYESTSCLIIAGGKGC